MYPLHILLTGSSGMVGQELSFFLRNQGHSIQSLAHKKRTNAAFWINNKSIPTEAFENVNVCIHLAGSPIDKYWTSKNKALIYESRVGMTHLLCQKLATLKSPPHTLIMASGLHIDLFLDKTESPVTECTKTDNSFLATLVKDWELAAKPALERGIRVIYLRTGLILSPKGGFFKKISLPFRFGLGSTLANESHYLSWISIEDVIRVIVFCINNSAVSGPINLTSPCPITNKEFSQAVASLYNKKVYFNIPEFWIKLFLGQMGKETILTSLKSYPKTLIDLGFDFKHSDITSFLSSLKI